LRSGVLTEHFGGLEIENQLTAAPSIPGLH
jgi:hypothetical protein